MFDRKLTRDKSFFYITDELHFFNAMFPISSFDSMCQDHGTICICTKSTTYELYNGSHVDERYEEYLKIIKSTEEEYEWQMIK
jgi:hypothetical protein